MARRPHGTGSVYEDKARGRWVGTYEAGWTANGTRRRRKVTGKTEREVRAKLREALRKVDDAASVGPRPTVKRWAEEWLETTATTLRPSTWATNRSAINLWVIPTIGHKRLEALKPSAVRAVGANILAAGRSPATARRAQAITLWMLRDAVRDTKHVPEGVLLTRGFEVPESDRDAIPLHDARLLLDVHKNTGRAARWYAALMQGMRPAECRGLTWQAVDFDHGLIDVSWQLKALPYRVPRDRSSGFRVPVGYEVRQVHGALHLVRPKTKKGRRLIPMVDSVGEHLLLWREMAPKSRAGLVWPSADGSPMRDDDDRAAWVELQDRAQVARVEGDVGRRYALYECRHTTATLLRAAGADDQTIADIMGHSTILSTRAYLHTDQVRTRAALARMEAAYEIEA